jgi:hypothetical protein
MFFERSEILGFNIFLYLLHVPLAMAFFFSAFFLIFNNRDTLLILACQPHGRKELFFLIEADSRE